MTDLDDIPWGASTTGLALAHPRRWKHRHQWDWAPAPEYMSTTVILECSICHQPKNETASKRGKNNRSRGNAIEREVCKLLGIKRVGQYGGSEDGGSADDWVVVQVKSGGTYPERIDALLRALPYRADRLRAVVHADTPGPGKRRRMLISLDLGEFAEWYGGKSDE